MASKAKHCKSRECKNYEYKESYCIDCFRKFAQTKGKRSAKVGKKPGAKGANAETLSNLVSGLNRQKKFGKMVKYSLQCIQKMAVDEAAVEEILASGAIQASMNAMESNMQDEDVITSIGQIVATSCVNDEATAAVCRNMEGKFGGFVESLNTHLSEDTLVATCQAMGALSKDPAGRRGLAESGGIAALAKCVKEHPYNLEMLRGGALALANFSKDPAYARQLMESGAMALILEAMKRFPDDLALTEAVAQLVANLAKSDPEIARQLKDMGAIDALTDALEHHPYSDFLLEQAQDALRYLAGESEIQSALQTITTGFAGKKADKKMAKAVSKTAALCLVAENVDFMHKHGGVDAVVTVMKSVVADSSPAGVGVLTGGARTLQRLASDPKKSYAIMQSGAVRLMAVGLQGQIRDAQAAEASIAALAAVMDRKEHALYVGKVGGVEGMLSAVREHPLDVHVAKSAIKFIKGMAQYPESADLVVDKGAVPALVAMLRTHMANPEITRSALDTIAMLADIEKGRAALIHAGAVPLLVRAIQEHADNPEVIKSALKAMLKTLQDPAAAELFRRAGAVAAIMSALDNFPGDPELQALGQKVLRMLADQPEIKVAQARVVAERQEREVAEEKKKKAAVDEIEEELKRNQDLWEVEMKRRKETEADRLRAYEEIKRREAEVLAMQNERTKMELDRRAALEQQQQAIREQQEMIQRIKIEKKEKIKRKEEAKRDQWEKEAWKKYEATLADKPDMDRLRAKAKVRALVSGEEVQKEESDEEDDMI